MTKSNSAIGWVGIVVAIIGFVLLAMGLVLNIFKSSRGSWYQWLLLGLGLVLFLVGLILFIVYMSKESKIGEVDYD